jgi:hypothetical protein
MRNVYSILVEKLKVRRSPHKESRHKWENSIRMYLKLIGCVSVA